MKFIIKKQSKKDLSRRGVLSLTYGDVQTPVFMPCSTVGSVKGVSSDDLKEMNYEIILSNNYHLYLRPGEKEIAKNKGLQKWTNWNKPILTDSGGYQVFSLGKNFKDHSGKNVKASLVDVTNDGAWFKSHLDGSKHFFTPEKVIDIQKDLGSDIMMVLDECTEFPAKYERARISMEVTHEWAKRAKEYFNRFVSEKQALFGIIQGSTYKNLRFKSVKEISKLDFDGIAVGGVSVGEGKSNMYKVIKWVGSKLPKNKPHYLMGVGEPEDIIFAVKHGFDMFDCVLPTRLGRHGTVWTTSNWNKFDKIDLRKSIYKNDLRVIMKDCGCPACSKKYSRSYIGHLIRSSEMLGMRLSSLHNLWIINKLMQKIREDI